MNTSKKYVFHKNTFSEDYRFYKGKYLIENYISEREGKVQWKYLIFKEPFDKIQFIGWLFNHVFWSAKNSPDIPGSI